MTNSARLSRLLAVLLFTASITWASVTGSISGTVKDPSGAIVASVSVTATNTQTGTRSVSTTNADGVYSFLSLVPGRYEIQAEGSGFGTFRETDVVIDVNSAIRIDISLQLRQVSEQVVVSSSAVHVETESTQLGEVIGSNKMTSIPLNGRSYTDLFALQPGVVPVSTGLYQAVSPSGGLNSGSMSVSGQRETANGFMVNGGNVEEGTVNSAAVIPNLDSIAEFRIITNNFDAEYGNYSGGQINAITKSGTNQIHGTVFEFLRNTSLDARNFFSAERGAFHQNQFGGTIGGPVVKNKIFFFADYQGTRSVIGVDAGEIPVPSEALRNGDLSSVASQLAIQGSAPGSGDPVNVPTTVVGDYYASVLTQTFGTPISAGMPYYFQAGWRHPDDRTQTYASSCTSNTQCVFPNAAFPISMFSAPASAMLKYIPLPNRSSGKFSTSAFNARTGDDKGSVRVDADTRWGRLAAYYFLDDYNLDSPYPDGAANLPGANAITSGRAHMLNLSDTTPLSGGTAFNEFRIQYLRNYTLLTKPQGSIGPKLADLGFVVGANTPGIVPLDPSTEGVPLISLELSGINFGGPAYYQYQTNNTYQIIDNFSKVKGAHTLKFGANFHYDHITMYDFGANNGTFIFNGGETGSDVVDFLLGAPINYTQGYQLPMHSRARYLGLYGQDSWRVRPNFTLNYGMRWEVSTPWYEENNQLETIVPGLQSKVFPGAPKGWVVPGDPGIPSTVAPTRYRNFGPRIGFAYSPEGKEGWMRRLLGGSGNTSLRAGYGIYYTAIEEMTNALVIGDAPFGYFYSSVGPPLFATPFITRADGSGSQRFPVPISTNPGPEHPNTSVDWSRYAPISSSPGYLHTNGLPSTQQFNLSLQRAFGKDTILGVSYVGTQGRHLLALLEANPANPALCASLPGCGPYNEDGTFTAPGGSVITGTRPLSPGLGSNGLYANISNSNYNALQATLRHATKRFEFLAGYTYSKSMDWSSALQELVNPFNPKLTKAISAFDMAHNFVFSYQVELPFDKVFHENRWSKGWMLSGITRFTTGLPVTIHDSSDNSLLGTYGTGPGGALLDEPTFTPGSLSLGHTPRECIGKSECQPYFNTGLFTDEPLGQLGNSKRRFFHGPGINNWDMALLKDLRFTEAKSIQLRFEFFNVFNHTQFGPPSGEYGDPNFGMIQSAGPARVGQVAAKFIF